MRLTGALYDVNNGVGTSGQVLSSTVTGTDWVDISSIGIGGSGTTNYLPKFTAGTTLGNSVLYEASGNVGIGTTGPGAKLEISGGSLRISELDIAPKQSAWLTSVDSRIYTSTGTGAYPFDDTGKLILQSRSDSARDIVFATGATTPSVRMVIGSTGNVGIGTTGPGNTLTVSGDPGVIGIHRPTNTNSATLGQLLFSALDSASNVTTYADFIPRIVDNTDTSEDGSLTLRTMRAGTTTEAVRIDNLGNVGIGTTSPGQKLDV